jgi:translation initiation factor IF-3
MQHKDVGFEKINQLIEKCKDVAIVELRPKFEGSKLICRLAPQKTKVSN